MARISHDLADTLARRQTASRLRSHNPRLPIGRRGERWRLKPPSCLSAGASPASRPCAFSPSETTEPPAVVVGWWCIATLPHSFCFAAASPSDHAGYDEPRAGALGTSFPWILPGLAQGWYTGAAPAQQNTGQGRTGGLRWLALRAALYPPAPFPFAPLPCPCRPKGRQGERWRLKPPSF